jgi:ATP/maltotriose-dependent transcriptional regulator MalT
LRTIPFERPGDVLTLVGVIPGRRRLGGGSLFATARWYERNGLLTDAVRHAARAGDWQLAVGLVIDQLAVGQIIEPRDGHRLAEEFADMPLDQTWTWPQPQLISAALALSAGRYETCAAALDAADGLLQHCPADQQATSRLTAAVIRLTASLRTGDLTAAATAASRAELMLSGVPDARLARHPDLSRRVLSGRAAVELWSGQLDEAARLLEAGAAGAAAGGEYEQACWAGQLALVEALRGRLGRAAELAGQADIVASEQRSHGSNPNAASLVALAWVHLQRNELRETRGWIKQADAALGVSPDRLIGALAYLVAAGGALAEGRATVAAQIITRARSGWPVPAWLDQQLSLVESRACEAVGDTRAALAAAEQAGLDTSLEAAVALAHAWAAAGDGESAQHALAPVLIEPLTDREREVLVHVSGLLNTAEVASEMYISVNTVKTHLRNIYRKLAAAHRSEAVRRARQLKLI